ncbi:sortase B protein-sorting domain-containing protein [Shewanella sediminis]|uniref:sortase B protein-sorting domain-containing protein n=1 Tax=Shewanella sediminis TaxID=271097 RepID=UPI0012323B85
MKKLSGSDSSKMGLLVTIILLSFFPLVGSPSIEFTSSPQLAVEAKRLAMKRDRYDLLPCIGSPYMSTFRLAEEKVNSFLTI